MTFKQKLNQEHPECVDIVFPGGCSGCPSKYGYEKSKKNGLCGGDNYKTDSATCRKCWNREMPEPEKKAKKDIAEALTKVADDARKAAEGMQKLATVEQLLEDHYSQEESEPAPRQKRIYVPVAPKKTTGAILLGCAKTIAYECKQNINCDGCVFSDNEKACIFADDNNPIFPENWMVPLATLEEVERGEESDG